MNSAQDYSHNKA